MEESSNESVEDATEFRLGIDIEVNTDDEELVCQHYRVKRIENLGKCKKLRKLAVIASCVKEIEGLDEQGEEMEHLEIYQGLVKEIRNISHLTNLKVLDLSFNKIAKIEGIETLTNLEKLYLSNNRISVIENLGSLKKLKVLELGSNRIRKITGLEGLTELEELWLGKNKIESMLDLDEFEFPHLRQLSLQSNRLTGWSGVLFTTVAPNLENLYLGSNALPDPSSEEVAGLNADTLEEIDLSCNKLTEIPDFPKPLHVLEELWLNDNQITKTDSFHRLRLFLPVLRTIYMERNPVQVECPLDYRNQLRSNLPQSVVQIDATMISSGEQIVFSSTETEPPMKSILKH